MVLAAIQVADTRLGQAISRPLAVARQGFIRTRLGRDLTQSVSQVVGTLRAVAALPGLFWLVLALLIVAWYLAAFSYDAATNKDWTGPFALATVGSMVALAIASRLRYEHRGGRSQPAVTDNDKENRIAQLRRQIYGIAGVLLKYADPKTFPTTSWDQVESLNTLLYRLSAEGEDVNAFITPFGWRVAIEVVPPYVDNYLLRPKLEALLVYLKTVGLPSAKGLSD